MHTELAIKRPDLYPVVSNVISRVHNGCLCVHPKVFLRHSPNGLSLMARLTESAYRASFFRVELPSPCGTFGPADFPDICEPGTEA